MAIPFEPPRKIGTSTGIEWHSNSDCSDGVIPNPSQSLERAYMATKSSDDFIFKKTSNGDYVRKGFGIEVTVAKMADMADGHGHLMASAALKIDGIEPVPTRASLEPSVRAVWVAMRHQVPGIACRAFKTDDSFALRYAVPKSPEEVDAWVKETVFFTDDVKPMRVAYQQLKDGLWWLPSDDRYVAELHISPSQEGWNISLSLLHFSFDARAAFSLLQVFLDFLIVELRGKARPLSSIEWGTETVRLQPTGPFIKSIVEYGRPPEIAPPPNATAESTESRPNGTEQPKLVVKPWLFAPTSVGGHGNISRDITFSTETTEKLHAAAKKHGYTMTQFFTSLYILAHAEAEFQTAGKRGAERFRELSGSFKDATHYLIAWTFVNYRYNLPGGRNSLKSDVGSPILAADGDSPVMPVDPVRSMFKLDESNCSVSRVVDTTAFWDGLVATVAATLRAIDSSLDAYLARAIAAHSTSQNFHPDVFHISAPVVSSIGDLGRLGILNDYLPPKQASSVETPSLVVTDLVTAVRCVKAVPVYLLYQYNGQLASHFGTSGEYTTEETLDLTIKILREWVDALTSGL